jgi:hypothetical protein
MKRLVDQADPRLGALTALVASSEPHQSSPFSKRHVQSRIARVLQGGAGKRLLLRPAWLAAGGLLIAGAAAAAGYSWLGPAKQSAPIAPPAAVLAPSVQPASVVPRAARPADEPAPAEAASAPDAPSAKHEAKPQAGEDPSQVAEAVRALRKQGDAARAQALLDQYLKTNPHGALAEDALALSIEAAAARKDPRAADYARRYLARYPNGRFRNVAERMVSK